MPRIGDVDLPGVSSTTPEALAEFYVAELEAYEALEFWLSGVRRKLTLAVQTNGPIETPKGRLVVQLGRLVLEDPDIPRLDRYRREGAPHKPPGG